MALGIRSEGHDRGLLLHPAQADQEVARAELQGDLIALLERLQDQDKRGNEGPHCQSTAAFTAEAYVSRAEGSLLEGEAGAAEALRMADSVNIY